MALGAVVMKVKFRMKRRHHVDVRFDPPMEKVRLLVSSLIFAKLQFQMQTLSSSVQIWMAEGLAASHSSALVPEQGH